jgi:hypothetical protein
MFYEIGPVVGIAKMREYFEAQVVAGRLAARAGRGLTSRHDLPLMKSPDRLIS